jgi:hypothetical protein
VPDPNGARADLARQVLDQPRPVEPQWAILHPHDVRCEPLRSLRGFMRTGEQLPTGDIDLVFER